MAHVFFLYRRVSRKNPKKSLCETMIFIRSLKKWQGRKEALALNWLVPKSVLTGKVDSAMKPGTKPSPLAIFQLRLKYAGRIKSKDDAQKITEMRSNLESERIKAAVLDVELEDADKELSRRAKVSDGWKKIARKASSLVLAEKKAEELALAKLAAAREAAKLNAQESVQAQASSPNIEPMQRLQRCCRTTADPLPSGAAPRGGAPDREGGGDAAQGGGVGH
jgi:hypothetical protein